MKSSALFWMFAGAVLSWIGAGVAALYVLFPSITGLIFAQPITIVSVPFVAGTGANGQPLDPRLVITFLVFSLTAFGALLGLVGWAIFRPHRASKS